MSPLHIFIAIPGKNTQNLNFSEFSLHNTAHSFCVPALLLQFQAQ